MAVAATYAFRNIAEREALTQGVSALITQARTDVFHDAFLVGAGFTTAALLVTIVLLPLTKATAQDTDTPAHA